MTLHATQAHLAAQIEAAFEERATLTPTSASPDIIEAVGQAIGLLDSGTARVAEKIGGNWHVHQWLKKAVLLSFRLFDNVPIAAGYTQFYDKVPLKYSQHDAGRFRAEGVRVVPPAVVRRGAHISRNVVLMPSYVNIGAHVGEGTMVDTWATVGSCAQIGRNVHLSGGVGIGGVLEPLQASVEEGAVLSMGVYVGQSTRIYDRERDEVSYGRIPAGAVVVPGTLPAASGKYGLACAVIVKRVDAQTRAKVGINELLRTTE